jgi:hypothetical protein
MGRSVNGVQQTAGRRARLANLKRWVGAGAKLGRNVAIGVVGFAALTQMSATSARASDSLVSFAENKFVKGDVAQADLDAVDIATQISEATGNYFYGYAALDGLL